MNRTFTLSPIAKAIVAFVGGLVAFLVGLLSDGNFTAQDGGVLAVWLLQTMGVYSVPNKGSISASTESADA